MTCCQPTDLKITRAAMCHLCPAGCRNARGSVVACTLSGKPLGGHLRGVEPCPRGLHPDDLGRVRWLGLRWWGVPWPLRWLLTASQSRRVPGCGCLCALRRGWGPESQSRPQ